jgi:YggT family protein
MILQTTMTSIIRALDIFFGIVGLALILRVALQIFSVQRKNPALKLIIAGTDPVLDLTDRILGIPSYSGGDSSPAARLDLLNSLAALILIWSTRTMVVWVLELFIVIPVWAAAPLTNIGGMLIYILQLFFNLYRLALSVRILFSWLRVSYINSSLVRLIWHVTEPVLAPLRSALPPLAGFDLSPIIAFFLLRLLQRLVLSMVSWVF